MLSITFDSSEACSRVQLDARRHGLIIGAADRHLKLAPPFTIDDDAIDELTQRLIHAIGSASHH